MTDQDPELRQLLAAARQGMSPMLEDAERVRARLRSVLPASGTEPEPAAAPGAPARAPRLARLGWLALGLGVGGLSGYALGQRHPLHVEVESQSVAAPVRVASEEPPMPREPAPVPPSPEATPEASSSAPRLESDAGRSAKSSRGHQPRHPVAQAADEQVQGADKLQTDDKVQGADEVALMKRVNRALGRGEAAWALALLRQIDVEVPQGRLLEERAAGGAIARCMLNPQVGPEELARYTASYPNSVHLARVSQVCTRNVGNSP